MDKSIGDDPTMKPKDGRNKRGAFAPGDVIAGRYVVESIIGEGGMGIVYQCLDRVGGVKVAVKCLPPEVSRNADEMEDIRDNYRLVADLHHPNIAGARTLEKDEATGDYYLVMDLAPGMSLKRWMKRNPQATTKARLSILRQVAAALDYAHSEKVIHRDVKPENVMVSDDGRVKVLDFGLAAQIRSSQSRTSAAVTSRSGTWGYMSPEQWKGKPQRESADVYSFGVLAYWMFAGVLPFDGDDPAVLGVAVLTMTADPVAGLPAHMNAALAKALEKEPDKRFASCGAVVDALEGGTSPVSGEESGGSRGSMMGKIAAGVALLTVAAVGGWWWTTAREETKVPTIVQPPVSPVPPVRDPASDVPPVPSEDTGSTPNSPSKIEGVAEGRGSMTTQQNLPVAQKHGDTKTLTLPGGATMEMIYVGSGEFMMGSPTSEDGRYDDETQHQVTLTKGFWLGKYEVTQEQWQSVMGENPSYFKGARNPVENVSWEDCQKFIEKVNARLNCGARLPTEAEWEYACRAGTTTAYFWGNALNGDKANCDGNYPCGNTQKGRFLQRTTQVGSYDANPWGFYDMHGNVYEWCYDWYDKDYYKNSPTDDPQGPSSGGNRVLRGGCWYGDARNCRSARRFWGRPGDCSDYYGFRLCCSAE